jgi:ABC-type lipoprotein export system ATPase subunit
MGGLDKVDSGEIIIQNKSSKDFSQDDFDSYRNTYLGFIFQEYNILNEFNIHDNIALALQLQNKPANDEAINADPEGSGFGRLRQTEDERTLRRPEAAGRHRPGLGEESVDHLCR